MKLLIGQWEHASEREEVLGKELLEALGLLKKERGQYALKHSLPATQAALLRAHTAYLHAQLGVTEEACAAEQKTQVLLLHRYNQVKDAAQAILGLLAQREGRSLRATAAAHHAPALEE